MYALAYALLALLLLLVIGSMAWLTSISGRAHKASMEQAHKESPRLVAQSRSTRHRAAQRRDECRELAAALPESTPS